jgi:hypothetical protein
MLAGQFRDTFEVVILSSGRLSTRKALLQVILFELGQSYRGMDEGELRLAVVDYLTAHDKCREGMVLLVDEAHTLPFRLLEEIRMLTNLVCGGEPRTRLVLAGGAQLEERFASPKLESFSQRIAARCYLESFNRGETEQYVHAQINSAGGQGHEIFPSEACQAIYHATDGIPRLINQVCDHALLLACSNGCRSVDRKVVEEAWADLQQLPAPWNGDGADNANQQAVIEFGGLEDEEGDLDEADDEVARCLPMLRVMEGNDETEEPAEQVEQIQEALAGLETGLESAATIGLEAETVFEDPQDPAGEEMETRNPFDEEFREEEVVVERFGSLAPDEGSVVSSSEGSEQQWVDPGPAEPSVESVTIWTAPAVEASAVPPEGAGHCEIVFPFASQCAGILEQEVVWPIESTCQAHSRDLEQALDRLRAACSTETRIGGEGPCGESPSLPAFDAFAEEPSHEAAERESRVWDDGPETLPLCRRPPVDDAQTDGTSRDGDLILVEEGYEDIEGPHDQPISRVRRQDYRRLFATLRRGS